MSINHLPIEHVDLYFILLDQVDVNLAEIYVGWSFTFYKNKFSM